MPHTIVPHNESKGFFTLALPPDDILAAGVLGPLVQRSKRRYGSAGVTTIERGSV